SQGQRNVRHGEQRPDHHQPRWLGAPARQGLRAQDDPERRHGRPAGQDRAQALGHQARRRGPHAPGPRRQRPAVAQRHLYSAARSAGFIVQHDEMKAAWWPDVGCSVYYIHGDFADSKKYNMIRLDGDLDLFGDKSIEFRRAPGHTPGSQFAVVRLPKTGTVVLTSDVVYLKESLEKNLIPPIPGAWNPGLMYESYQKIRLVRDGEKASIFYGHDPDVFKATKQAPAYYE